MSFMVLANTVDHAAANNYTLFNGNGSKLNKYNTAKGICEARADDGFMFDESSTSYDDTFNEDFTICYWDADIRNRNSFIINTKVFEAAGPPPEPKAIPQSQIDAVLAKNLVIKVDDEVAVADVIYDPEVNTVRIHSIDDRVIVATDGYDLNFDELSVTIPDWYNVDLGALDIQLEVKPPTFTQEIINYYLYDASWNGSISLSIDGEPVNTTDYYPSSKVLKFTAPEGYLINRVTSDYLDDDFNYLTVPTISYDKTYATLVDYDASLLVEYDWTLEEVYVEPEPDPIPTFTQDILDHFEALHLDLYINDEPVDLVTEYDRSEYLTFKLQEEHQGRIIDIFSNQIDDDLNWIRPPEIMTDSLSARIKNYEVDWLFGFVWDIEPVKTVNPEVPAVGEQGGDSTRGVMNTYNMNPLDVPQFTTDFHGTYWDGLGGTEYTEDRSKFIISMIQLPFSIQDNLVFVEDTFIKLGKKPTTFKADQLTIDTLKYNIGEIHTPATHGNLLDYANTTTILHLPLVTPLVIDTQYVVGQTLQIEYVISLTTGECDINIRSSALDEGKGFGLVNSLSVNLNATIPWGRPDDRPTNDPASIGIVTDNNVTQAYVEVVTNKPTNIDGVWTIPVNDENLISTADGYIEVDNIDLVSKASRSEKQSIISLLSQGVKIN